MSEDDSDANSSVGESEGDISDPKSKTDLVKIEHLKIIRTIGTGNRDVFVEFKTQNCIINLEKLNYPIIKLWYLLLLLSTLQRIFQSNPLWPNLIRDTPLFSIIQYNPDQRYQDKCCTVQALIDHFLINSYSSFKQITSIKKFKLSIIQTDWSLISLNSIKLMSIIGKILKTNDRIIARPHDFLSIFRSYVLWISIAWLQTF